MNCFRVPLIAVLSLFIALMAVRGGVAQEPTVMRISHQFPPEHQIAKATDLLAARIEEKTGGTVDVEIFPANAAFSPRQNYPAVARGRFKTISCARNASSRSLGSIRPACRS